jgi:hypothetical protein
VGSHFLLSRLYEITQFGVLFYDVFEIVIMKIFFHVIVMCIGHVLHNVLVICIQHITSFKRLRNDSYDFRIFKHIHYMVRSLSNSVLKIFIIISEIHSVKIVKSVHMTQLVEIIKISTCECIISLTVPQQSYEHCKWNCRFGDQFRIYIVSYTEHCLLRSVVFFTEVNPIVPCLGLNRLSANRHIRDKASYEYVSYILNFLEECVQTRVLKTGVPSVVVRPRGGIYVKKNPMSTMSQNTNLIGREIVSDKFDAEEAQTQMMHKTIAVEVRGTMNGFSVMGPTAATWKPVEGKGPLIFGTDGSSSIDTDLTSATNAIKNVTIRKATLLQSYNTFPVSLGVSVNCLPHNEVVDTGDKYTFTTIPNTAVNTPSVLFETGESVSEASEWRKNYAKFTNTNLETQDVLKVPGQSRPY